MRSEGASLQAVDVGPLSYHQLSTFEDNRDYPRRAGEECCTHQIEPKRVRLNFGLIWAAKRIPEKKRPRTLTNNGESGNLTTAKALAVRRGFGALGSLVAGSSPAKPLLSP